MEGSAAQAEGRARAKAPRYKMSWGRSREWRRWEVSPGREAEAMQESGLEVGMPPSFPKVYRGYYGPMGPMSPGPTTDKWDEFQGVSKSQPCEQQGCAGPWKGALSHPDGLYAKGSSGGGTVPDRCGRPLCLPPGPSHSSGGLC